MGEAVRYDGSSCPIPEKYRESLGKKFILLPFCPENAAGLTTPREPIIMVQNTTQTIIRTRDSHIFMPEIPTRTIPAATVSLPDSSRKIIPEY